MATVMTKLNIIHIFGFLFLFSNELFWMIFNSKIHYFSYNGSLCSTSFQCRQRIDTEDRDIRFYFCVFSVNVGTHHYFY